jgi:hypothetical protein
MEVPARSRENICCRLPENTLRIKIHDAVISPASDAGLFLPLGRYLFRVS